VIADVSPKPGTNIFRDVTTDPITRKPHKVKVCGPWLQFDEDEPIQLPEPGMHVRLRVTDGVRVALVRGHDTDHIYVVNVHAGAVDMGKIMGDYPAAFGPDGSFHIQRDNSRPDFAAEGLHHIEPDGRWVMNNAPELNTTITELIAPDGKQRVAQIDMLQCSRAGDWVVGKCDALVNSGIAHFNTRTGQLWHFGQYSQMPPFTNEQGWVAIQGSEWKMTPEPDAVPWIRHEDLPVKPGPIVTPPPVVPPPPAPADCRAERAKITDLERWLSLETSRNADLHVEIAKLHAERLTPEQVIKLVNDATGKMAGYWRYLGVQGAVDRAVKAELRKRT
jgi:hypothetical protein